ISFKIPHAARVATGPFRRSARSENARAFARALRLRVPPARRARRRHRRSERDPERVPVALAAARASPVLAVRDARARRIRREPRLVLPAQSEARRTSRAVGAAPRDRRGSAGRGLGLW